MTPAPCSSLRPILQERHIVLVITGGIAAYKTLDLIRELRRSGAEVRVVLTDAGAQFVTPVTLTALSGNPVYQNLWPTEFPHTSDPYPDGMAHIHLARWADLIIIAPATADRIAHLALGLASDFTDTFLLAATTPIIIAPAMNPTMWNHPATVQNMATLSDRGLIIIPPTAGIMACGEDGEGRMADNSTLYDAITTALIPHPHLLGRTALVTSGPTHEPIDPVRFIGNRSSGKQGHAIAAALAAHGASVTLITGPTALTPPIGLRTLSVTTADDMLNACLESLPVDIVVCAAAVADWRLTNQHPHKIKKTPGQSPVLTLTENTDILATIAQKTSPRPSLVVGFAAETDNLLPNAREKRLRKGCDWILANQVSAHEGFEQDDNEVTLITQQSEVTWPRQNKTSVANLLARAIADFFSTQPSNTP